MNLIKISLKNNKKYIKLLLALLCLGFFIGFILIKKVNLESLLENITSLDNYINTNRINFLTDHILTILILCFSSLTVLGLILFPLNFIYEGICIFFNIYTLSRVFKLSGFVYGLIYNIIIKGIYLIMLVLIFKKIVIFIKNFFRKREKEEQKILINKSLMQLGIYTMIIFLNDLILYLFGNKILSFFLILIK